MKKILLLVEDYNDNSTFFKLFKKLGFDCDTVVRDALLGDVLVKFIPDLVIVGAMGRSFDFKRVEPRLVKLYPRPKIAFLQKKQNTPDMRAAYLQPPSEMMSSFDASIELPVEPTAFLKFICGLVSLPEKVILEKYEKLIQSQKMAPETGSAFAGSSANASKPELTVVNGASERTQKYDQFLVKQTISDEEMKRTLPRAIARKAMQELAEAVKDEKSTLDDLDQQRRDFVRKMFTNKHG